MPPWVRANGHAATGQNCGPGYVPPRCSATGEPTASVEADGEHYKLIRDMTASTPRPSPLINDEAARQVSVLERLRERCTCAWLTRVRVKTGIPV